MTMSNEVNHEVSVPVVNLNFTPEQDALLDEWATLLESGDYRQGTGRLCRLGEGGGLTYCCLGVLCDMLQRKGLMPDGYSWDADLRTVICPVGDKVSHGQGHVFGTRAAYMPPDVVLASVFGESGDAIGSACASANDSLQAPFSAIAEAIRTRNFFLERYMHPNATF